MDDVVHQLVGGLPRDIADYVKAGQRSANGRGNFTTNFKGNIGRLYVCGNSHANCNNWIAGSFKGHRLTREMIHLGASDLVYIGALPESSKLYYGTAHEVLPFDEVFSPLNKAADAYEDSEYLLLNALAHMIDVTGVDRGSAYLLTERIPCASCTHVVNEFINKFVNFELQIFYMFDSPNRNVADFKTECRFPAKVKISYLTFSDWNTVDIVGPL